VRGEFSEHAIVTTRTYTLRPATDADSGFLETLHAATMRHVVEQIWGWDAADQHERFHREFDASRSQIVVVDGMDAGVIAIEKREDGWFLANIQIGPAYQSRGLGSRLIGAILAGAHAASLSVTLQVLKVNRARRLYERLGFVTAGETDTHFLMRAAHRLPRTIGGDSHQIDP
jgi:ribosomal protein S18 acetylase RimI-like enzyme